MGWFLRSLLGSVVWLLALPTQAGIADDISLPVFKEMRFSRDSIALVSPHGVYKIGRKPGIAEPIDQQILSKEFIESNSPKVGILRASNGDDIIGDRWVVSDGTVFESRPGYCDEGVEIALQFWKNGHPLETFLDKCDRVSALAVVNRQLWLGSVSPGEWGDGPGTGVHVLSLHKGRLLVQMLPKMDLADGFVQFIQGDPIRNDVWIATRTALHRIHQFKVVSRWYVSEQFSSSGKVTYEFSFKPRQSSPWAIFARATGITEPTNPVWKQLQDQPKLLDRLRFAYDEEGFFFSVDGLKLELIDQPDDLLPTNPPATWPKDFDWLMSALMSTLRQTPSMDGAKLPETTFMALRQLCFFKDPRVVPFVLDWQRKHSSGGNLEWAVDKCLGLQRQLLRVP